MQPTGARESHQADLLQHAFQRFDQAAASLQQTYRGLMERLERMDLEMAAKNETLRTTLKEKEEMRSHLAAVLESLTTGVIVTDQRGTIVRCNEAAQTLIGCPRTDVLGRPVTVFPWTRDLQSDASPVLILNETPVCVTQTLLKDDKGRENGSILLLNDISRVRKLEERLQRKNRLAAMGEMVGRIAHEIRNPLGSVELFASMLGRDLEADPQGRAYTEHISSAVQAMDRLLSNLLSYTRPATPSPDWHSAEQLVREAVGMAVHATGHLSVAVRCGAADDVPMLWCDAGQLKQVLLNLVLNAAQATAAGGQLVVTVSVGGAGSGDRAWVRLAVTDTGTGIDPADMTRLFDPFFTTKEEGTGLGLAIVHAIVEGHRGRVEVDSTVGRGSTFTVVLPGGPQCPPVEGDAGAPVRSWLLESQEGKG